MTPQENKTEVSFLKKLEVGILKLCPQFIKTAANKIIGKLPSKYGNWIKNHKFLSICIAYSIRGLFFRPSMWAVYAAIAAYFGFR